MPSALLPRFVHTSPFQARDFLGPIPNGADEWCSPATGSKSSPLEASLVDRHCDGTCCWRDDMSRLLRIAIYQISIAVVGMTAL